MDTNQTRIKLALNSIERVKQFSNAISKMNFEADLISGRHVVDAKSIMGVFSLDLRVPVELVIHDAEQGIINDFCGTIGSMIVR